MFEENTPSTADNKTKQRRTLLLVSGILVCVAGGIGYFMENSTSSTTDKTQTETLNFTSPVTEVNAQKIWIEREQNAIQEQAKQTAALKNEVAEIRKNPMLPPVENDPRYQELLKQNQLMQEALNTKHDQLVTSDNSVTQGTRGNALAPNLSDGRLQDGAGIDNDELKLKSSTEELPKKNPDSFVPAGTFAEAIMLGAADASAGVQAQSNPSPMLFRIIADGTLPNHRKGHLKDCMVTAAVVGDISSERGEIRLERMSCTYPDGEIVEQLVEGTAFGMDAKSGVRGNPLWREGALLARAAAAGTLSGLGSAVAQSYTTNSISPLGSTQTVNNGDIAKYGAAQGAANAMDKLAEYNIRRAEQYHPVIQLTAGQPVDIVFLKGFYLDGKKHEETSEETNKPPQLFPSSLNRATPSGLTLSEKELEKIKQHEAALGVARSDQHQAEGTQS
jgi:conjugal transfer pilus assembly protein TraB